MNKSQFDLGRLLEESKSYDHLTFDVVVNTACYTEVDGCETQPEKAYRVNAYGAAALAAFCRKKRTRFVHFSSDYVFDGLKGDAYEEHDLPAPLNVYGSSKRLGERLVLEEDPQALIIRTSWLFGGGRAAFPEWVLAQVGQGRIPKVVDDRVGSPTKAEDLAQWVALLIARYPQVGGLIHLSNQGWCSWSDYAQFVLAVAGVPGQIDRVKGESIPEMVARRPRFAPLSSSRFVELTGEHPRPWQEAVAAHIAARTK